jgi:hypothetical protein
MSAFESVLRRGVDISLLTTSCFSGGWVITPSLSPLTATGLPKKPLNITAMSATDQTNVTLSWAQSASCGRAAGGIFATAVLNALLVTEGRTPGNPGMFTALNSMVENTDDGEPIDDSPTYGQLAQSIFDAMNALQPNLPNRVTFSAQDDKWDSEWRRRSGFPLVRYKELWEQLEMVPPGTPEGPEGKPGSAGGSISKAKQNVIRAKASAYMMSLPGSDAAGVNAIHSRLKKLIAGEQYDDDELKIFDAVIDYRYNLMRRATEYVFFLDLNFVDCLWFDVEHWIRQNYADKSEMAARSRSRYETIFGLIMSSKIFDRQVQGLPFQKPKQYLAIALAESHLSLDQVRNSIATLLRCKSYLHLSTIFSTNQKPLQ